VTAEQTLASVGFVMLAGQLLSAGACVSFTVTVNEQLAELPAASPTVQLPVVSPFGKAVPDAGLQFGAPTPGQLSVAVVVYVVTAVHTFGSADLVILAGQAIAGACVSFTVTMNEQLELFPDKSITAQVTVVTPFAKRVPDAGLQVGEPTPGQLSLTAGVA
jgi:hypothetical protein